MNKREINQIVKKAGGSTLTKEARSAALLATATTLRTELNIQLKSLSSLKSLHLEKLVNSWKEQGLSLRTMQNRMTHVRAALRFHGREHFADSPRNSNAALGLAGASRQGTHTVPSPEAISTRITSLAPGAKAAANLQVTLGLRAGEAIQSVKSLRTWQKQLQAGRPLTVLYGTKGGRPRDIQLHTKNAHEAASEAVRGAIEVMARQGGHLIESTSLEGATRSYQRSMQSAGFTGSEASHSLRYHWARQQFETHMQRFGNKAEALTALSLDLGHGDGRGRYCAQVYLKGWVPQE